MESINGESKYCNSFDYVSISKQIDNLREELLDLKFNDPDPSSMFSLDIIKPERKSFRNKCKLPDLSMKSRSRKIDHLLHENENVNSSQFFRNLMNTRSKPDREQLVDNRHYVKQSRVRPEYLDQYIRQMHSQQSTRELYPIDEPIRSRNRDISATTNPSDRVTDSIPIKSDAGIQSERFECNQSTITDPVCIQTEHPLSDTSSVHSNKEHDSHTNLIQSAPIPFSVLDFDDLIDDNCGCVSTSSNVVSNPSSNNIVSAKQSDDINDDSLFVLILQMFSRWMLLESDPSRVQSHELSERDSTPLVKVSIDVMISVVNGSEFVYPRLSIEVISDNPKYIVYAEPTPAPSDLDSSTIHSEELQCDDECDDESQISQSNIIHDEVLRPDLNSECLELPFNSATLSPRSRQHTSRRSTASRTVELRQSSANNTVSQVEVVEIDEFGSNSGILHLEEYEETQVQLDALSESQLVQPCSYVLKDIVEVMIIVCPGSSDVSVAIKINDLASICIGPGWFSSPLDTTNPSIESPPYLGEKGNVGLDECDVVSSESGRVDEGAAGLDDAKQDMNLLSYMESSSISDSSSSSSDDSDSCKSTTGRDHGKLALGFGSVFSSGEFTNVYSDGEIMPSMLFSNQALEYLSDTTDSGSLS